MCFPRNPSLGRYSGTKQEWKNLYRKARLLVGKPNPKANGLEWKAQLIAKDERFSIDPLTISLDGRLVGWQVINEILKE